jgi:hypothetical protein
MFWNASMSIINPDLFDKMQICEIVTLKKMTGSREAVTTKIVHKRWKAKKTLKTQSTHHEY